MHNSTLLAFYLGIFICLQAPIPIKAQSIRDVVDGARLIEDLFGNQDTTQCDNPPEANDTTANWDETLRSSDEDGQKSTQYTPKNSQALPPKDSKRAGCVCMDNTIQDEAGRGSCSGHGGVRYWRYVTPDAEVIDVPTDRHYNHPQDLSPDELNQLAASYENRHTPPSSNMGALVQIVMIMMVCSTAAYIAKQMWNS